jgi:hypothetical protein
MDFCNQIKILGYTFGTTIADSRNLHWGAAINAVRVQAPTMYQRNLNLAQRVRFVNVYLFSKLWFAAQILAPNGPHVKRINAIGAWFVWSGVIFRVLLATLTLPTLQGGWALHNVEVKCKTMLYYRLWTLSTSSETPTAVWLRRWNLAGRQHNPPWNVTVPRALSYLRAFARDMAYVPPAELTESGKDFKLRLIRTLQTMADNDRNRPEMRIVTKYPGTQWNNVWNNLQHPVLNYSVKSTWYMVVHEIVPTNERMAAKQITTTDRCCRCARLDSLPHRLSDCQEEGCVWAWTK